MRSRGGSSRVLSTHPPIMQIMKSLKRGEEVIDLSQGIPFFDPPEAPIRRALSGVYDSHRYGPDGGDPDLLEAISKKLGSVNSIDAAASGGIMVTPGANMGFFMSAASLCDHGDEVILIDPYYFNHRMSLDILGVRSVHVPTDGEGIPDIDSLRSSVNERTRAVVVVSPNNPTGCVYDEPILRGIADLCGEEGIVLISDETYEDFHYDSGHFSPGSLAGEDLDVVSLFSLSKSYGLSGWRIGYMSFPESLYDSLLKVQDTTTICASRIGQVAALECIRTGPEHLKDHLPVMRRNRDAVSSWLWENSSVLRSPDPRGAFYSFPGIVDERWKAMGSMELSRVILERGGVLVVPGEPFGADKPPHFRISYGNVLPHTLGEGLERISDVLSRGP